MMLFGRHLRDIPRALFDHRRYQTFARMKATYPEFWSNLGRFLSARGSYPYECEIDSPLGRVPVTLFSHHDLFTLNEVFCRLDYEVDNRARVVLDLGSNIGISALYFLTRHPKSFCYLHEPNPGNIERLRANLAGFEKRYHLSTSAIGEVRGRVRFGVESSGRYGGIGVRGEKRITVQCEPINDAIERVLERHPKIDLIKIDTEGNEVKLVKAIEPRYLDRIGAVFLEAVPKEKLLPWSFVQEQRFSICRLSRKLGV